MNKEEKKRALAYSVIEDFIYEGKNINEIKDIAKVLKLRISDFEIDKIYRKIISSNTES